MYYDRNKKEIIEEIEYKKNTLHFLYSTKFGRLLLKLFIARPWFSKLCGLYKKSALSKKDIEPFARKYGIKIKQSDMKKFHSFNDFFIRKRPPIKQKHKDELIAVADAKLSYYEISDDLQLKIKNSIYCIDDLLENRKIASFFQGGTCLVFRLAVNDNHRYVFIDDGKLAFNKKIRGKLHTIRPIAAKHNVFIQNSREVNLLNTKNLGYVAQVEIGALLVGKINNHDKTSFKKTDEKGYFEFGGSTIVVLLNKKIKFDEDIAQMNSEGVEIQVSAGEKIGVIIN